MAHFAKLDDDNIVTDVYKVANETLDSSNEEASGIEFLTGWSGGYTNWKQCSYNANFRKRYPAIGDKYDSVRDAFITPQPYPSWSLDDDGDWIAPLPYPSDGLIYVWNEETQDWEAANFN